MASYLTNIAMLWWQPHLIAQPEPSIHSTWNKFVAELNNLFGQPDISQASECALHTLKMQDYQHVNQYMIKFSEMQPTLAGMMWPSMVSSIEDLLNISRTSSYLWIACKHSNNSRPTP